MSVRFGIIGCGNISKTHIEAMKGVPNLEIVAVVDEQPAAAQRIAQAYDLKTSALEDLWDQVDAVSVLLPSALHAPIAIEAARRGKHVLTEKPLDVRLTPALAMVEACEAAGVRLGCISQHRFARDIAALQSRVTSGDLGRMIQGDAYVKWFRSQAYYDSAGWRGTWAMDGGGCLMNQGVHYIDMIQWIMGGVAAVQARTFTLAHEIEVEDTAMAIVEYRSGAVGLIQGSTAVYPGFSERLEVHGTQGSAMIRGDRLVSWTTRNPEEQEPFGGKESPIDPDADPTLGFPEQHRLQIADFVDAVKEGRDPAITGRAALEPLKIILAIYESSRRGGERVDLEELVA